MIAVRDGGAGLMGRMLCPILVGREEELAALEDALLAAKRGEGQVVALTGDAGIGKTRLTDELERRARKLGCVVMTGGCTEADLSIPYLPFLEGIGNHLADGDIDRLRAQLGPARRALARLFPQLSTERDVEAFDDDPTQAKLRLFEAVLTLLRSSSEESGLLLVIEDMHWSDASTRELLDYLTRRIRNWSAMVLVTYRGDELHREHPLHTMVQAWRRSSQVQVVELAPLSGEEIARMVRAILDSDAVSIEFRDFLRRRSEGNPFVLEEVLRAASDRGDLYKTEKGWERKAIEDLRLPSTVRDTIMARVARLDPNQADVLRAAAVLGASFEHRALTVVSGLDEPTVDAALLVATSQQLVHESPDARGQYQFRHALTREAIYEEMTAPTREKLHLRAAHLLLERDRRSAADVAHHLIAANRWDEAIPVCLDAATDAERTHAYLQAMSLYELVLPRVTEKAARGRLLCRLGDAAWRVGQARKALDYFTGGIALLEETGEPVEAARHRTTLGRCYYDGMRPDLARTEYEKARDVLQAAGPSEALATVYVRLATLLSVNFEGEAAQAAAEEGVRIATLAGADGVRIWGRGVLGLALGAQGRNDEELERLDESYREASGRGFDWLAGSALYNSIITRWTSLRARECPPLIERLKRLPGHWSSLEAPLTESAISLLLGQVQASLRAAQELTEAARQLDNAWDLRYGELFQAKAYLELGLNNEARAFVRRPDPARERQGAFDDAEIWIAFHLACRDSKTAAEGASVFLAAPESAIGDAGVRELAVEALLADGRPADARRLGPTARENPRDPWVQKIKARLLQASGEAGAARDLLRDSLNTFIKAGYVIDELRVRLLLAEACTQLADRTEAEAQLREVVTRARRFGLVLREQEACHQLVALGLPVPVAEPESERAVGTDRPSVDGDFLAPAERFVTVLFADIRGYTAMTAATSPSELLDRIATFHRWAKREIERRRGLVDKFAGDAVMATFNAAGSRVDHCLDALQAAVGIRDKAALMDLPVGVGIAVGPAVVGQLVDGANVTVLGETTNLAARLQSQAKAGQILLSQETKRRVEAWLRANQVVFDEVHLNLKGFEKTVTAFAVTDRRTESVSAGQAGQR